MSGPLTALAARLEAISAHYADAFEIRRDRDWFALKVAEELGEVQQAYLRRTGRARTDGDVDALGDEMADLLGQLLLFARSEGVDLDAAMRRKWLGHEAKLAEEPVARSVSIRDAGPDDGDALLAMMKGLQAAERELNANRVDPEEIGPHLDNVMKGLADADGFCLIAEAEGRAVGALWAVESEDEDLYILPENRRTGYVSDLYVSPEARRKGVATALMAEAERRFTARGLPFMEISALAANAPARALYARWAGGENAVGYAKALRAR